MSNYQTFKSLDNVLKNSKKITDKIESISKEEFANNETLLTIAIGFIAELKQIFMSFDDKPYILNKDFSDLAHSTIDFASNLLNKYNLPNAYKVYDYIKIDLKKLKDFVSSIEA